MRPTEKRKTHAQPLMGSVRLDLMLNMEHELVRLAAAIDWTALVEAFGPFYSEKKGRPGVPIRTMAGLVMLQHTFGLSDDAVVEKWPENAYWQFFCGEEFFQHEIPICASQMTRWRRRIGEAGVERLLKLTIEAGLRTKTVTPKQMQVVVVDTTVQPKAVEHPTDARLFRKVLHLPGDFLDYRVSKGLTVYNYAAFATEGNLRKLLSASLLHTSSASL